MESSREQKLYQEPLRKTPEKLTDEELRRREAELEKDPEGQALYKELFGHLFDETQGKLTSEELHRRTLAELGTFREDPALYRVRRLAEHLDFDDKCGGEAARAYRKEFREVARQIEYLKYYGFTALVRGEVQDKDRGITVEITRKENPDRTLVLYHQTFRPHPEGFPRKYHEQYLGDIVGKATDAVTVAKMFGVKPSESPSA